MRLLLSTACILALTTSLVAQIAGSGQPGARALFYDPISGAPAFAAVPPSPATGLTPVGSFGVSFVGVHYWFEDDLGAKFATPVDAGEGAHLRMHVRGNVTAWLTLWLSDPQNPSVELTPRTDAGPEGRWSGYRLLRDQDYVVPREFVVSHGDQAAHVVLFWARCQCEQVDSAASARIKLQPIASGERGPRLIEEIDRTTPGQIGTYVVRVVYSQIGTEIVMGR
jgi:hypothetical protein